MADHIPITAAERIGKDHAYDQVIIYARRVGEPGLEWVTTWGKDRTHCDVAARIGDAIRRQVVKPIEERDAEIARLRALLARAGEALAPFADACDVISQAEWFIPAVEGCDVGQHLVARNVAREIAEAMGHE